MSKPTPVINARKAKKSAAAWTASDLETFALNLRAVVLSDSLFKRHRLQKGRNDDEAVRGCILTCADAAFATKPRATAARRSLDQVVKPLTALLNVIERQRKHQIDDPAREGLELFVMYSQRAEAPEELMDWPDLELFKPQHDPTPAVLPRDRFRDIGSYWTIGNDVGWLELLLKKINAKLAARPVSDGRRGPKGKRDVRDYFIWSMAEFYKSRGGPIVVYNNAASGKIEGRFISFLDEVLIMCPEPLRSYLSVGLPDAVLEWRDQCSSE